MSIMQRICKVRFEGRRSEGGGRAKWTLISSSNVGEASILKLELPDGSSLKPEAIAAIDQLSSKRGFQDPVTIAKTVGVTAGSLIIGDYLIGELFVDTFNKIDVLLRLALEQSDNDATLQHLVELTEELLVRTAAAVIIGSGAIAAPAAYAGYALSKREVRLRIAMQSGEIHTVKLPEYVGGFLVGAYEAVTGVVDEDPVSSDSSDSNETEANADALTPESEAPAPA